MTRRTFQKLVGLGLVVLNIVGAVLLKDLSAAILLVPLGIYAMVTKEDILVLMGKQEGAEE